MERIQLPPLDDPSRRSSGTTSLANCSCRALRCRRPAATVRSGERGDRQYRPFPQLGSRVSCIRELCTVKRSHICGCERLSERDQNRAATYERGAGDQFHVTIFHVTMLSVIPAS